MKILGYTLMAAGLIAMVVNGKPRHWEKGKLPVWVRIVIEVAAMAASGFGFEFAGR